MELFHYTEILLEQLKMVGCTVLVGLCLTMFWHAPYKPTNGVRWDLLSDLDSLRCNQEASDGPKHVPDCVLLDLGQPSVGASVSPSVWHLPVTFKEVESLLRSHLVPQSLYQIDIISAVTSCSSCWLAHHSMPSMAVTQKLYEINQNITQKKVSS